MKHQYSFEVVIKGYSNNIMNFCKDFTEIHDNIIEFNIDYLENTQEEIRYLSYGFCEDSLQKILESIKNLSEQYKLDMEFVSTEPDTNTLEHIIVNKGIVVLYDKRDLLTEQDLEVLENFIDDVSYWSYFDDIVSSKYTILNREVAEYPNDEIIVVSGYNCKDVVREYIKTNDKVEVLVSSTTRSPKPEEVDGVDYNFISDDDFLNKLENGEFTEHSMIGGFLYGSPKPDMISNKVRIINLDVKGAYKFKQIYPNCTTIFFIPESMKKLEKLDSDKFSRMYFDIIGSFDFDYFIINKNIKKAVSELNNIVRASKNKFNKDIISDLIYRR